MKHNTWQKLENAVLETSIFELLEGRQMMSASPVGSASINAKGVLTVNGDAKLPTQITIDYHNNGTLLHVHSGQYQQDFSPSQVKKLVINAGAGNDYIYIDSTMVIPSDIHGGDGNDTIHGSGGNDTIYGGDGDDAINGKGGNDLIYGDNGNDSLWGATGNDSIYGGAGNDAIAAGSGNDIVDGGTGNDSMWGEAGNDILNTGGAGTSYVSGGMGDDTLTGVSSSDKLYGNSGTNTIDGADGTTVGNQNTGNGTTGTGDTGTGVGTGTGNTGTGAGNTGGTGSGTSGTGTTAGSGNGSGTGSTTGSGTGSGTGTGVTTGTGTGTTTGTGTGTTTGTGTGGTTGNVAAPVPVINVLDGVRQTGLGVNVDALSTQLVSGTPLTARYDWNFGDPSGSHNQMTGYNGAHVYDTPGTYTITLTVTNEDGGVASVTSQVNVAASMRTKYFVDAINGSDTNSGSQTAPFKSLDRAFTKTADNSEILLKAGETFNIVNTLHIKGQNIVVGRYGNGTDPVVSKTATKDLSIISVDSSCDGITIQHVTFDTPYGVSEDQQAPKIHVQGIYPRGTNNTIRNCTFLNVDDAINENGLPTGVLIQDNAAPLDTGVRGYFVWAMGSEQVVIGNTVANSTREHCMRMVETHEFTIADNTFDNQDRRSVDPYDYSKGTIEMHRGDYTYITGNTIEGGNIRSGPLGLWGEDPATRTEWCVIEDNNLTGTRIYVKSGSEHIMIRNNVIAWDGKMAIAMDGVDAEGRITDDVTIQNNTAINNGTAGNFLAVQGYATGIVLKNNLWIAPNISTKGSGTAAVYVKYGDLSLFTDISNNIWPSPAVNSYAKDGVNYVGLASTAANYENDSTWNANSQVHDDTFENVNLNSSYQIMLKGLKIGSSLQMAA